MRASLLAFLLVACLPPSAFSDEPTLSVAMRTADLNVGESQEIVFANGKKVTLKLLDLKERCDDLRQAVRVAEVTVAVDGQKGSLESANYRLPITVAGVQIDCPVTKGYRQNSTTGVAGDNPWGLDKDVRLRAWPAGEPLLTPGSFLYPARQRWFASGTQMANEPTHVDAGENPLVKKIYYHYGLDIGGAEGLVEVVAATDGIVVSAGKALLKGHEDTPAKPRYDVVYLLDERGWYYRYSHLHTIAASIKPGTKVKMGQLVGLLGKEGGSGGWSHLHFDITGKQPSGKWGIIEGYAFLWEAYQRQHQPKLLAVARPHQIAAVGEKIVLDGSRSWSSAGKISAYDWTFTDGAKAAGSKVERTYSKPGTYSEVLKIRDGSGRIDYDFAVVNVFDKDQTDRLPPSIHAVYYPTFDIKPGDPVTFLVRTFRTTDGKETWNFGDGSAKVEVQSDGNVVPLAKDGYARTVHRFERAGHYVVRVERTNRFGFTAVGHVHVRVGDSVAARPPDPIRAAVAKSLTLLTKSAAEYTVRRQCFSCHHQALPILAFTEAKARGFDVDEEELHRQLQFTADFLAKNRANYEKGKGQWGQVDTAGYALLALAAGGWKADATTAAVVEYLLLRDKDRDHWQVTSQRPPTEASSLTTTFLALNGLKAYGSAQKKEAIDARSDRVSGWFASAPTKDTEDRVFRLKGLHVLGSEKANLQSAVQELMKTQRGDGGWSQTDKLESDAYATGSVLAALHQAGGVPTNDAAYRRGVDYLVKTQRTDGSWHVQSRSKPFQLYFESGFPHGKDQFISCAASSWATIALLLACEPALKKSPE